MANDNKPRGFTPRNVLVPGPCAFPFWNGLLASNQTIAVGDALIASAGYLYIAPANSYKIVGVSNQATVSVGDNPEVLFTPAVDWIVFSGQASGTPTQAKIWTNCDIEGATGAQMIDENATSLNVVRIIDLWGGTTMGQYAELLFIWNKSAFTGKNQS